MADGPVQPTFLPSANQLALAYAESGSIDRAAIATARGVGRPKGAQNKRSQKLAKYFVAQYGDPIDIYGNIMSMPLEALVETIRVADQGDESETLDRLEALIDKAYRHLDKKDGQQLYRQLMKFMTRKQIGAMDVAEWWRKMVADAMTYVHGRQPISVEVAERKDAVLIIPGINAPTDVSQQDIAAAIEKHGLDAIDFHNMRMVDEVEFIDVDGSAAGDEAA